MKPLAPSRQRATRATKTGRPTRAPGRPTTEQSDEIGDVLIEAALRSFMDRGFEGTTMDAIAKDAKIARITVYRRFGDKRELFRQVSRFALQRFNSHLRDELQTEGPPEVVLRSMIHRLLDAHLNPEYLSVMRLAIFESARFPELARSYWNEVDFGLLPMTEYLEKLQSEGRVSIPSAREAAMQFSALAVGGVRFLLVRPSMAPGSREHWVESVYTTFSRAWGLDSCHLADIRAKPVSGKPARRSRPSTGL